MIPSFKHKQTMLFFCELLDSGKRVVKKSETPREVYEDLKSFDESYFSIHKRHSSLIFE